jgi:hypothetical protein
MRAALLAGLALVVLGAGCGSTVQAPKRAIAVDDGLYSSFLRSVDPVTLVPRGPRLRLRDFFVDSPSPDHLTVSPDGRTLAIGGANLAEITLVDVASLRRTARLRVIRPVARTGVSLQVESWPRPHRLIAVVSPWAYKIRHPGPERLVLVDPVRRRVVRRIILRGGVWGAGRLADGTVAVLTRGGAGAPRIVEMGPDGRTRSVRIRGFRIPTRGVRVGREYFPREVRPAFATDGRSRAFVTVGGPRIAEVDLRTLAVRFRAVGMHGAPLPGARPEPAGSGGVHFESRPFLTWLGGGLLGVNGGDERPVLTSSGIEAFRHQWAFQVIDTLAWRGLGTLPMYTCEGLRGLLLCSAPAKRFNLAVYGHDLRLRYRKDSWWDVKDGRLFVGSGNSVSAELNPATGVRIRRLSTPLWGGVELFSP